MLVRRMFVIAGRACPRVDRLAVAVLAMLAVLVAVAPAPAAVLLETGGGAPVVPIIFPFEDRVSWTDTFGAPRSGGRTHEGNDIMVPKMTPLLAVVDGTMDWMNLTGRTSSYNGLPYYNILLRGDDGNDYFYIHLNNDTPGTDDGRGGVENAYAQGLTNGSRVTAGQVIGYAGDSGNAEDSGSHLHFEIHLGGYDNPIDPYNSLKAAPTYAEWLAARGGAGTTTTVPSPTTTTTRPPTTTVPAPTTSTTRPPTTTTTEDPDPGPGGQLDPEVPRFSDVSAGDWFYDDLAVAYRAGVVNGGSDGRFGPYREVTRAQFAAFLVRAFAPGSVGGSGSDTQLFGDVSPSFWGYAEIQAAAAAGLVRGVGDGTRFAPNAAITRAQMATMVCRALQGVEGLGGDLAEIPAAPVAEPGDGRAFADVPDGYWAAGEIALAQELGVIGGGSDGRFRPEETTKRAHAVCVIARALRLLEEGSGA